jgi:hypothetical protein
MAIPPAALDQPDIRRWRIKASARTIAAAISWAGAAPAGVDPTLKLRVVTDADIAADSAERTRLKPTPCALALLSALLAAGTEAAAPRPAPASPAPPPKTSTTSTTSTTTTTTSNGSRIEAVRESTTEIVTQPARDVGVSRRAIPPPLQKAAQDPYNLKGLKRCPQLAAEIAQLNGVLGADYHAGEAYQENRVAKLAEAGGRTVVNSILPFRSLVREVSGAAPADRRLRAASNAGFARRGFLRGVFVARGCKAQL